MESIPAVGAGSATARLVEPSERYRDSFLEGAAEFDGEGRLGSTYAAGLGYDLARLDRDLPSFLRDLRRLGEPPGPGWNRYRDRVYWLVDDDLYLGQTSIRPELNSRYLITYGGHVGYSIRPRRRRRGYGRRILELALRRCRELGLERVLVTCDEDNLASRRIIEANGGLFESEMVMDARTARSEGRGRGGIRKRRYWIELAGIPS